MSTRTTAPGPAPRMKRVAAAALLLLAAVGLTACCCDDDDPYGFLYLWNRTDATTNELVVEFAIAPDGLALPGNILPGVLPPGDEDYLGEWHEDVYDAAALLELGDIVDFFNFFIGGYGDTVLEVF